MQSLDLEQARELLDFILKEGRDHTPEQQEALAQLEYALINANKLKSMFFGMIDQVSVNEVNKWRLTVAAMWDGAPLPGAPSDVPRTLH